MTTEKTISATDLEDFDEVDVVEVLVSVGDEISKNQSIVTFESDKAMLEFPSPEAGIVQSIAINIGDKVKQGDALITVTTSNSNSIAEEVTSAVKQEALIEEKPIQAASANAGVRSEEKTITATDLEDFDEVDVVEILVAPGDEITKDQSIVTLESDKAMMEFPSPETGTVVSVAVNVGDKIKQGDALIIMTASSSSTTSTNVESSSTSLEQTNNHTKDLIDRPQQSARLEPAEKDKAYASPMVRKYANELGVDLAQVQGTAQQGRVLKQDVQGYVKNNVSAKGENLHSAQTLGPLPDFSEYGATEEVPLNKLRQVSAERLAHSWRVSPHVTQFEEADITDLEKARKKLKGQIEEKGAKLSVLPFIMKALVKCMAEFPDFNSTINESVTGLIHKKYFHVGIAVDTPRGLLVPVIKDVDQKKIPVLAQELLELSTRARDGKLSPREMQGGCMSITSLGGVGGQYFTPIINQPEVAILGVSRATNKLMKRDGEIVERLMLPLSLSYDHRAIDGVAAVKFITSLKNKLNDVWSLML